MSALLPHPQSVGALAPRSPLALATFTPALQCVHCNAEFARLTGREPDRMPGLAWGDLFPRTSLHDLATLRAVLSGTATGPAIQLPVTHRHRRQRDDTRLAKEWAGVVTAPMCHPATAYLIDIPGAAPLLGVASRRSGTWSTDDVAGLWTDTGLATVGRRIDTFFRRWPWGPAWVVLLATAGETAPGRPGWLGHDGADLLSLTSHLIASFRDGDCLSVLDGRWPVLACPIDRAADAGPLADRFRATVQQWSGAGSAVPAFDFRMALGRREPGRAAELLALLDTCPEQNPRTNPRPVPVHGT